MVVLCSGEAFVVELDGLYSGTETDPVGLTSFDVEGLAGETGTPVPVGETSVLFCDGYGYAGGTYDEPVGEISMPLL